MCRKSRKIPALFLLAGDAANRQNNQADFGLEGFDTQNGKNPASTQNTGEGGLKQAQDTNNGPIVQDGSAETFGQIFGTQTDDGTKAQVSVDGQESKSPQSEPDVNPDIPDSSQYPKGKNGFQLKGKKYSQKYAAKLIELYDYFYDQGYKMREHALNRILGRTKQGKIVSPEQVLDILRKGTRFEDPIHDNIVVYKDGITIPIDKSDGAIITVIGESTIKPEWRPSK